MLNSAREELERMLAKKNVNYPTMLRRIKDSFTCEEKGARKDDELDRRATKNLSLSLKGLVYLVLNAELTERESRTIVDSARERPLPRRALKSAFSLCPCKWARIALLLFHSHLQSRYSSASSRHRFEGNLCGNATLCFPFSPKLSLQPAWPATA